MDKQPALEFARKGQQGTVAMSRRNNLDTDRHIVIRYPAWQRDRGQAERIGKRCEGRMPARTNRLAVDLGGV